MAAVNEVQAVTVDATGGTFDLEWGNPTRVKQKIVVVGTDGTYTLTFGDQTTDPLAHDADAAAVQTALRGLSNVGATEATVTGTQAGFTVVFSGTLDRPDVALLEGTDVDLVGTNHGVTVTSLDRAYGLAFDISAANLQTALRALTSIGDANVVVTKPAAVYVCTFSGTGLAGQNVPRLVPYSTNLTGNTHTASVETTTPGHAAAPSSPGTRDLGVPMHDGDPAEPVGPEDALGVGEKRGDYSGRGDGSDHYIGTAAQAYGPWGEHADQPTKKGGVTTTA